MWCIDLFNEQRNIKFTKFFKSNEFSFCFVSDFIKEPDKVVVLSKLVYSTHFEVLFKFFVSTKYKSIEMLKALEFSKMMKYFVQFLLKI